MESTPKADFGKLCRALRNRKGLKQREVAVQIGIKPATYGNVESSRWKVIRRDRVPALAAALGATAEEASQLMDAWDRWPFSAYSERQRERWAKRNALRSKVRQHDVLQRSLIEVILLLIGVAPDPDSLCNCEFGGGTADDPSRSCELCEALEALGLDSYISRQRTIEQLLKLHDRLEAAAHKTAA